MKLYAQMGWGNGNKVCEGLKERYIDGVIISPKDQNKSAIMSLIGEIRAQPDYDHENIDILVDPQFYTSLYATNENIKLGKITDWDFFKAFSKRELTKEKVTDNILYNFYQEIAEFGVTSIITPTVYISSSLDSKEAVAAYNFLSAAKRIALENGEKRPIIASICINREALLNPREFEEFINEITVLDNPPDGFYLIIGGRDYSDLFHSDVIANWMMINYSLALNDFKVINGYSDLITPLLGIVGGYAGASGWWSNTRSFSINRFMPTNSGGRMPIVRYLSLKLFNRITHLELEMINNLEASFMNGLKQDSTYDPEPRRNQEVLQSWEALRTLCLLDESIPLKERFKEMQTYLNQSLDCYNSLKNKGVIFDRNSDEYHISPIIDGINSFMKKAQIV